MSSRKIHLFAGLAVALVVTACRDTPVEPGSISLSIAMTSATVLQGGRQPVAATLTRIGGFSGSVSVTVTGVPSGVTAAVSDIQTAGAVTTATITIVVGSSVEAAVYPLVVHGTGSGVGEVTQAFTLTVEPDLGFSISLSATALSIVQGASTPTTTVNITRGNYCCSVGLHVTGLPAGVTDSFDPVSWPAENSTVLTLTVDARAVPGSYNLQVSAYDPEQEGEVNVPLTLTVTAPPPASGYTLSLSASGLSIAQSAWSPLTTVNLIRTDFSRDVTLSVDNLPTGVSALFQPVSSNPGSPMGMWLFVAGDAAIGTYTNLLVRGVASGLSDRTAPLTLTITVAPFLFTLSSSTLAIVQGTAAPTTTVNLVRHDFTGPVILYAYSDLNAEGALPPGVTAAFSPNPVTGNSSVLTLSVAAATVPGVYNIWVYGEASTGWCEELLTLTVTAATSP